MSRLLELLPPYERSSKVFKEIMQAEEKQFDNLNIDIQDLEKQFFIDSATWGLSIYEKELGLPIRANKSLDERRSAIKAKWRGTGKVDAAMIRAIVAAFTRKSAEVGFDGRIGVAFVDQGNIRLSKDMYRAVKDVIPAHLGLDTQVENTTFISFSTHPRAWLFDYPLTSILKTATKPGKSLPSSLQMHSRDRTWKFGYPLTNTFSPQGAKGTITKTKLELRAQSRAFLFSYPLCGTFVTGEVSA